MNEFRIIYLPADIWQGVKASGLPLDAVVKGSDVFCQKFSDQDLAAIHALQTCAPIVRALGSNGAFQPDFSDTGWNRYNSIIQPLAETSYIKDRLNNYLSGPVRAGDPPFQVVDLGQNAAGVVFGPGTFDALSKDNNVLTVLTAIVQKALLYGTTTSIMAGRAAPFLERFVAVNAFANPLRPPSAVYS